MDRVQVMAVLARALDPAVPVEALAAAMHRLAELDGAPAVAAGGLAPQETASARGHRELPSWP